MAIKKARKKTKQEIAVIITSIGNDEVDDVIIVQSSTEDGLRKKLRKCLKWPIMEHLINTGDGEASNTMAQEIIDDLLDEDNYDDHTYSKAYGHFVQVFFCPRTV